MMMSKFNYTTLAIAVASIGAIGSAHAAGLDRSGQDVTAFLQDGTYGEVVYTYIDADISGKDTSGNSISDIAEAYDFARFGVKADINDTFSVGVLYDEPWGAAVQYGGSNNFVSQGADTTVNALTGGLAPNVATAQAGLSQAQAGIAQLQAAIAQTAAAGGDITALQAQLASTVTTARSLGSALNVASTAEAQQGEGTNVEIRTQNATLLLGAKLGEKKNFQIYGGPQMQRLTGEVHLRGTAYGPMTGYDANIGADMGYGWVAARPTNRRPEATRRAQSTSVDGLATGGVTTDGTTGEADGTTGGTTGGTSSNPTGSSCCLPATRCPSTTSCCSPAASTWPPCPCPDSGRSTIDSLTVASR